MVEDKKEDMIFSQAEEVNSFQMDTEGNIRLVNDKFDPEEDILMMETLRDNWNVEPVLNLEVAEDKESEMEEIIIEDAVNVATEAAEASFKNRRLLFWEVYVDEGNVSKYFLSKYGDVEVATFSLPEWDFLKKEDIEEFLKLVAEVKNRILFSLPLHARFGHQCRT